MDKSSLLVRKTAIYAIGNFGSKILAYIMVLVYSYFITTDELGYYDLILTSISMLQPLVLFQMNDGVYRYLVDSKREERSSIIGNGFYFLCLTTLLAEFLFLLVSFKLNIQYAVWIGALFVSTMFFVFLQDAVRGLSQSKLYAAMGVLNSVVMLLCEIVGLLLLRLGVLALLISKVIANLSCVLVMLVRVPDIRCAARHRMQYPTLLPLLKYSAPLVPNTISWWVVNSSSRYIILGFLGAASNGLFAMATKFPTILTTITSIFFLAWQESAIKEYHSPNRDQFFSDVFRKYYILLLTLCLCAVPATRFVIELFVADEYKTAWQYTGFLYLGAVFSALCSFLGMGYQISKETARSFGSTVFAAGLNILVNIGLIKLIGLQAASIATFAAYLFLFMIRIKHTKRYFILSVEWRKFWLLTGAVLGTIAVTAVLPSLWLALPICAVAAAFTLYMNRALLIPILNRIKKE